MTDVIIGATDGCKFLLALWRIFKTVDDLCKQFGSRWGSTRYGSSSEIPIVNCTLFSKHWLWSYFADNLETFISTILRWQTTLLTIIFIKTWLCHQKHFIEGRLVERFSWKHHPFRSNIKRNHKIDKSKVYLPKRIQIHFIVQLKVNYTRNNNCRLTYLELSNIIIK